MKLPSSSVLRRTAIVTVIAAAISISVSTGIRILAGAESDTITIVVRLILPFVIAIPLALVWFTKLDRLEESYRDLLKQAAILAQRANLDPLTGLLNRRSFVEQFELAMFHKVSGIFMVIDVDDLKRINDQHGHLAGDEAIISTADALRSSLGEKALIARIGGDEFCAFIEALDEDRMNDLISELASAVRNAFRKRTDGINKALTVSHGYVRCKPQQSFKDALSEADKELYIRKGSKLKAVA